MSKSFFEFHYELLNRNDTKATFFVVGELLEYKPELLDLILDNGHEIGFLNMKHTRVDTAGFQDEFDNQYPSPFLSTENKRPAITSLKSHSVELPASTIHQFDFCCWFFCEKCYEPFLTFFMKFS